jgi:hypothetical protein
MEWFKKREKISPKLRNQVSTRDKGICQVCGKMASYCDWKDGYWHCYEIVVINRDEYHI